MSWFKRITYNQSGFRIIETEKRQKLLYLSKIGKIPFRKHRKLKGVIKQITIKYHLSGKWFACITVEYKKLKDTKIHNQRMVGHFGNPKYLDKSLKRLGREQRRLSRKKKESRNRRKQKLRVAIVHEKIVNQRDDYLHKLSHYYTENYKFIAVAGSEVIKIDPRDTTQECSRCGHKVKKSLSVRIHTCPKCGLVIDRDYNAAINTLKSGLKRLKKTKNLNELKELGQGLSEFTPVEILVGGSMNQEAPY